MSDSQDKITYADRLKEKALFSFSFTPGERETELSSVDCTFHGLNNDDGHDFMIIERDDKKGFNVFMQNITVVPSNYVCIGDAPTWLRFLIRFACGTVIWGRGEK